MACELRYYKDVSCLEPFEKDIITEHFSGDVTLIMENGIEYDVLMYIKNVGNSNANVVKCKIDYIDLLTPPAIVDEAIYNITRTTVKIADFIAPNDVIKFVPKCTIERPVCGVIKRSMVFDFEYMAI